MIRENRDASWILHRARATDVIFNSGTGIDPRNSGVLERYIAAPLTVDGRKVSLLLYVAVTSLRPTRFYIYEDAEVHSSARLYSDDPDLLADSDIHRTRQPQVLMHIKSIFDQVV